MHNGSAALNGATCHGNHGFQEATAITITAITNNQKDFSSMSA
jgi:hypothetical protein